MLLRKQHRLQLAEPLDWEHQVDVAERIPAVVCEVGDGQVASLRGPENDAKRRVAREVEGAVSRLVGAAARHEGDGRLGERPPERRPGFLSGAWPFGVVEAVWAVVALRRFHTVRRRDASSAA
jgi:hypothetical protein